MAQIPVERRLPFCCFHVSWWEGTCATVFHRSFQLLGLGLFVLPVWFSITPSRSLTLAFLPFWLSITSFKGLALAFSFLPFWFSIPPSRSLVLHVLFKEQKNGFHHFPPATSLVSFDLCRFDFISSPLLPPTPAKRATGLGSVRVVQADRSIASSRVGLIDLRSFGAGVEYYAVELRALLVDGAPRTEHPETLHPNL